MPNPISIRDIRSADFEAIGRINAESSPGVSLLTSDDLERLTAQAALAWVAVRGKDIAGYLIGLTGASPYDGEEFAWFKKRGRHFVYIDQIALAPSFRGRDIGHLLYAQVERWAVRQLCESMNCEVNLEPPNPRSLAFHQRYGFSEVGRMQTRDGRQVALLHKDVRIGRPALPGEGMPGPNRDR
jgi:predicted GNAT superfamily acetyltransferase